jgi:hypothetical protein
MALFLNIFCRSDAPVTRSELARLAEEAWYGDEPLTFDPPAGTEEADRVGWERFEITLPGASRPIIVHRDVGAEAVKEFVEEELEEWGSTLPSDVSRHLGDTRQVIGLEVFPDDLGDDGWELLDVIESNLARRLDGVVVTSDGIYDSSLRLLVRPTP